MPLDSIRTLLESGPCSWSEGSTSHQGEQASPSDAVWKDEDREGGVQVHSDAVTKSSSDLLPSSVDAVAGLPPGLFSELYHSYR